MELSLVLDQQLIPHCGAGLRNGSRGQLENPSRSPMQPGNAIGNETRLHMHHAPISIPKDNVDGEPHGNGMHRLRGYDEHSRTGL